MQQSSTNILELAPRASTQKKTTTLYLAGPMSNLPEFNFPEFKRIAKALRQRGYTVFNPAEKDGEVVESGGGYASGDAIAASKDGFDFRSAYLWDVTAVIQSDGIYLLNGWEQSPGARGEHAVAVAMQRHFPEYKILYQGQD